jgi:hypothetical protein
MLLPVGATVIVVIDIGGETSAIGGLPQVAPAIVIEIDDGESLEG